MLFTNKEDNLMKRRFLSLFLAAVMILGTVIMSIPASADLNFNDTDGHWGKPAIEYVVENGLMNGVGNGESFAPDMSLTRGMVVTVLYRANGSPRTTFANTFSDVEEGKYYSDAAEWAYTSKIVNGTGVNEWGDPLFSPDRDITRQELATMFMRYASFRHVDTSKGSTDISAFPDASSVADWASEAVKWAVGFGLITGKGGSGTATLSPSDKASRAEFATIFQRFDNADFEYFIDYEKPKIMSKYTELPYPKAEDADVYVAVDGNDSNPGTLDKPLATFEAAKAKVRELRKTAKDEIIVAFKAGDYGVLDNVQFTADDSGSEDVPVTYCGYGDGEVYFTNGILITDDMYSPLTDDDKKLFREENLDKIKKVDLTNHPLAENIDATVSLSNSEGLMWVSRVPNKRYGFDAYFPGFTEFVPSEESIYDTIEEIKAADKAAIIYGPAEITKNLDAHRLQVTYRLKDALDSYDTYENVQLCGYISKVWVQDFINVDEYNKETGIVYFEKVTDNTFYATLHDQTSVYINGPSKELDGRGEFWRSGDDSKVFYIYDPAGEQFIATHDNFITGNGAKYITFRELNFRCTKAEPVILTRCDNITFDRTDISYVGDYDGFQVLECLNFTLKNSTFCYFYGYGIYVDGANIDDRDDYDYMSYDHMGILIDNNLFHHVAAVDTTADAAAVKLQRNLTGVTISHNEMYHSSRHAISFGVTVGDVLIEYNVFHDCMKNAADGGVIHNGVGLVEPMNVIRYNIFYDITSTLLGGTLGIYLDNYEAGNDIYGNIFYNVTQTFTALGGRDNSVHDNVMIKSGTIGFRIDEANGDLLRSCMPSEDSPYYEIWKEKVPFIFELHFEKDLTDPKSAYAPVNHAYNNVAFGSRDEFNFKEEHVALGRIENNVKYNLDENPFFVNPAIGDYRIREDADFHKIPYENIGRY